MQCSTSTYASLILNFFHSVIYKSLQDKINSFVDIGHPASVTLTLTSCFFRTRRIVNVIGGIKLSESQITLESNDSLCDLDGTKFKW